MLRVTVPGQPIAKGRPRMAIRGGHARAYTPAKTVAYEGLIAMAGQDAMNDAPPLEGPLGITVFAYFQMPKSSTRKFREEVAKGTAWHTGRPDGDNILKAAGDGLNGVVWRDDSQIASAQIVKLYGETPRLVIEVRPL